MTADFRVPDTVSFGQLIDEMERRQSVEYHGSFFMVRNKGTACECQDCLQERFGLRHELEKNACPNWLAKHLEQNATTQPFRQDSMVSWWIGHAELPASFDLCDCYHCQAFRQISKEAVSRNLPVPSPFEYAKWTLTNTAACAIERPTQDVKATEQFQKSKTAPPSIYAQGRRKKSKKSRR